MQWHRCEAPWPPFEVCSCRRKKIWKVGQGSCPNSRVVAPSFRFIPLSICAWPSGECCPPLSPDFANWHPLLFALVPAPSSYVQSPAYRSCADLCRLCGMGGGNVVSWRGRWRRRWCVGMAMAGVRCCLMAEAVLVRVRLDDVWPSWFARSGKKSVTLVGATVLPNALLTRWCVRRRGRFS